MVVEKEVKLKMRQCSACGKEYNIYTRPLIARFTCSEECRKVQRMKRREMYQEKKQERREIQRQKMKKRLVVLLIVGLITGCIGAVVGAYVFNAMRMIGDPGVVVLIGFAIGFFAPIVLYICD
jgi:hypothetical protein